MSCFSLRLMRLRKRLDPVSVNSRLLSLRGLASVFDNWPTLLKIFFLGGYTRATLHDQYGNKLLLEIDRVSVRRAIVLARALRNSDKYELTNEAINLCFDKYHEEFKLSEILSGDYAGFEYFMGMCWLAVFGAALRPDGDLYYRVSLDDLNWFVRRGHLGDFYCGPCLSRVFEPYEYRSWFLQILAQGGNFVDVGANVGGYTVRAAKLGANVIALEPDSENFALLLKNLALNDCPNVHPFSVAAGSSEHKAALYAPDEAGHSYSLVAGGGKLREYVDVKTLDEVVAGAIGESKIQLTKIDVEGNEFDVVVGATNVLKRSRYLMIEMWPENKERLLKLMKELGFKLADVGRSWRVTNEINLLFRRARS